MREDGVTVTSTVQVLAELAVDRATPAGETTNLEAQRPAIWDLTALAGSTRPGRRDLFIRILLASAAIPATFPAQHFAVTREDRTFDELHVDGGVSAQVFFSPAPPRRRGAEGLPVLWRKVLSDLWSKKINKDRIAAELHVPVYEIENVIFGLVLHTGAGVDDAGRPPSSGLRLVN